MGLGVCFFFFFMVGTSIVGAQLGHPGEAIRVSIHGTCFFLPLKGGNRCCLCSVGLPW